MIVNPPRPAGVHILDQPRDCTTTGRGFLRKASMKPEAQQKLAYMVRDIVSCGQILEDPCETEYRYQFDLTKQSRWLAQIRTLIRLLGHETPWSRQLAEIDSVMGRLTALQWQELMGTLEGISWALEHGYLAQIEGWILGEAFGSLLDQAEHLHSNGYDVAASVVSRSVLEEHLRNLCHRLRCEPEKERPTISDYKDRLYKEKHVGKVSMLHIESMAAIGNEAAHKGTATHDDTGRLLRDVRAFIDNHPLPL